ncbi:DgyrCDS7018 [Dimorphilus gyrociliatus]|uniref:DgyrCDS7018 n=1 Tax=Dimorphilus gyrociliatus TaxID=2664684 RepID=A0A7I8VPZ6_9ANNE|nr:DgyrCDS7018 [Dimorphilus gyrociliatus]
MANYLPPEWEDESRMNFLFAPFKRRSLNPESYDAKLKFWIKLIESHLSHHKNFKFQPKTLARQFLRKSLIPACLQDVIQHLYENQQVLTVQDFRRNCQRTGWIKWSWNMLVHKPVAWTFNKVWGTKKPEVDSEYVHLNLIESSSKELLTRYYSNRPNEGSNIVPWQDIILLMSDVCDDKSLELVILALQYQGHAIMIKDPQLGKFVKFAKEENERLFDFNPEELDKFRLEQMCNKLENAIRKKEDQMEECRTQAKIYLNQKQHTSAKQCLRRKKRLEASKIQLENQLDNFHVTLEKIAQSRNNAEVYEAMKSASSALKKNSLSVNQVDDVVDEINDAIDVQDDLNRSIVNVSHNDMIDQQELQDELDKILADENVCDIISDMPEVPKFEPAKPEMSKTGQKTHEMLIAS